MKKKILIAAAVVLALAIAAGGTLAYFTSRTVVHNVITTGEIKIDLIEKMQTPNGLVDFEDQSGVMPDTEVSKIVSVKNVGKNDAFIRVQVEKTVTLRDGVNATPDLDLIQIDYDTEHWTLRDGYYYYNEILEPGEETEVLFSAVSFAPEMGNEYQNAEVAISVLAEATQVANNGATALEASGWPA